ncbi:hypothetical protein MNBD_GAMMA11-1381 [hydrothermal vent metagenome]|uniref:Uncharacterized protein n=1 Tax=hydrothermal vent metagenome TaxID=652676 RepID=A0A3B0YD69_9ZZZZ
MACSHINGCELFVQFAMNPALELWKISYCKSRDYTHCARFKKSLSGLPIPLTLLPNGAFITDTGNENIGSASLFNAIVKHQTNMIRSLLRVGIDLNIRNIEGTTPLMAAAEYGVEDIAKILLENGAETTVVNNNNESAYDIAIKNKHLNIAKLLSPDKD